MRSVAIRSAISGIAWAFIGVLVWNVGFGRYGFSATNLWNLRGAILASPLIGVLVGITCAHVFQRSGLFARMAIGVVSLYVAAWLFIVANLVGAWATGRPVHVTVGSLVNSFGAVVYGLTFTGFVLVLGPLAVLNHAWVSRTLDPDLNSVRTA